MNLSSLLQLIQAMLALAPGILQVVTSVETMFASVPQSGAQKLQVVIGATQAAAASVPNTPVTPEHAASMATEVATVAVASANAAKLFQHGKAA